MKLVLKPHFFFIIGLVILLSSPKKSHASEGTFELTGNTPARCFAASVQMSDFEYRILLSCRDILYPTTAETFVYTLWAVPKEGGSSIRLGALGLGKAAYETKTAFTQLFVTVEKSSKPKTPSSSIIMRGNLDLIDMLQPGVTPVIEPSGPAEDFGEILEEPLPIPTNVTEEEEGFFAGVRKGSLFLALGVFVILIALAFLTRSRG